MELEYIKSKSGEIYRPQEHGVKDESKRIGNYPVCFIKKLSQGRFQIDFYDSFFSETYSFGDEDKPNKRLILYPSGIAEIGYKYQK